MSDPTKSPAVQSLNAEQSREQSSEADSLDTALEDTFPASDPVSATQSAVATPAGASNLSVDQGYPLVEDALRATGEISDDKASGRTSSLRRDASRLSEQASEVASGAVAVGKAEARSAVKSVEDLIRDRPLTAVGIVAAFAWLWGATR